MANIVITTHWLDGDVLPFIRIGRLLKLRGHDVTLITHCYFKHLAQLNGLQFEAWDTQEEYNLLLEFMTGGLPSSPESEKLKAFKKQFESISVRIKEYEKVLKHCQNEQTVIVAKSRSSIAAFMVAEKLQLPLATVFMNPMEPVSMLLYSELYGEKDVVEMNQLRENVGLSGISTWLQWHSSGKMAIGLWPEWFTNIEESDWPCKITNIGFPLEIQTNEDTYEIPDNIKQILSSKTPPIIITGGTTKMVNPKFYPMSSQACGLIDRPTILLGRYPELVPDNLPTNVVWCSYLPLQYILPKCAAIIHHGGIGTSAEALKSGIPQLILPFFGDGLYNGKQLKKIGVADCLPVIKWTPEIIKDSIQKLLLDGSKKQCLQYAKEIKQGDSISAACNMIESIIDNHNYIFKLNTL